MKKFIDGFNEDYAITDDGKVISYKHKEPRILSTWYQESGYENIKLCKGNSRYSKLVHRLVAEAFIPNPNNLPEVHHIDGNPKNNHVSNLQWCTRKFNLEESYETLSPTRNFFNCFLERVSDGEKIKEFNSIKACADWASKEYGCSPSYLRKSGKVSKGYRIVKMKV